MNRDKARSDGVFPRCPGDIAMTLGGDFFGFNAMFRPPLGNLPNFFTNFQTFYIGGHMGITGISIRNAFSASGYFRGRNRKAKSSDLK